MPTDGGRILDIQTQQGRDERQGFAEMGRVQAESAKAMGENAAKAIDKGVAGWRQGKSDKRSEEAHKIASDSAKQNMEMKNYDIKKRKAEEDFADKTGEDGMTNRERAFDRSGRQEEANLKNTQAGTAFTQKQAGSFGEELPREKAARLREENRQKLDNTIDEINIKEQEVKGLEDQLRKAPDDPILNDQYRRAHGQLLSLNDHAGKLASSLDDLQSPDLSVKKSMSRRNIAKAKKASEFSENIANVGVPGYTQDIDAVADIQVRTNNLARMADAAKLYSKSNYNSDEEAAALRRFVSYAPAADRARLEDRLSRSGTRSNEMKTIIAEEKARLEGDMARTKIRAGGKSYGPGIQRDLAAQEAALAEASKFSDEPGAGTSWGVTDRPLQQQRSNSQLVGPGGAPTMRGQ